MVGAASKYFNRIVSQTLVAAVFVALMFQVFDVSAQSAKSKTTAVGIETYRLGSGDKIRVLVFGQDELSGEFEVDGLGNISLPLIKVVSAGGLTISEFETVITNKLKPDFLINPRVSVSVLNYRPFYIIGEVKRPGSYSFVSGMRVVNAIALGGGFTYRAHHEKAILIRGGDEERKKEVVDHQTFILPGDVLEIPERFF